MSGNGGGALVYFDLGCGSTNRGPASAWASAGYMGATGSVSVVGTNGATFYLTGVKLEIGSVATPYNRQSLAKSMADCQRDIMSDQVGQAISAKVIWCWHEAANYLYGFLDFFLYHCVAFAD